MLYDNLPSLKGNVNCKWLRTSREKFKKSKLRKERTSPKSSSSCENNYSIIFWRPIVHTEHVLFFFPNKIGFSLKKSVGHSCFIFKGEGKGDQKVSLSFIVAHVWTRHHNQQDVFKLLSLQVLKTPYAPQSNIETQISCFSNFFILFRYEMCWGCPYRSHPFQKVDESFLHGKMDVVTFYKKL